MENKKTKIISIVALVALALTVITATYAYFQAQTGEGSQTDIKINANTVDTFTFETGSAINLSLDQTSFASGKGNITGNTYASAKLTANNKTNSATNNYNLYLNISDNNFGYTQNASYPEILLTIKDGNNNEITSISGLEYKTVTDGKGASIKGFDITTKTGLITLLSNREITTTSTKTDTWNITATFVNYNVDQSKNAGKSFSGQVLISKDSFEDYKPNTINTLSATKSGTNLTVNLNVEQGSNEIDKYYYAIEESNSIAMLNNNANKVQRLSNKLAANTLTYVESTSSSYTFTNVSASKDYKVSVYAIDKNKIKSNTYEYNYYSDDYVYPVINKVETNVLSSSIMVTVTATKGTNGITKYYYSIDGGNTFVESTSNSYTFTNLVKESNYRIAIKILDSNNKYSNIYIQNAITPAPVTLANYVISQYANVQGNNNIYYHDGTLENGINDGSYRYAGANPNNFVCFGSNAITCPEDNLYRIIGVFNGKVKLIKYDYATKDLLGINGEYSLSLSVETYGATSTYKGSLLNFDLYNWNSTTKTNAWSESNLNKINLNINFLNNIGTKWANKIIISTWVLSTNSNAIIYDSPSIIYNDEVSNLIDSDLFEAKVGLPYMSDYGFAASPSAWATKMNSYSSSAVAAVNWMYMGGSEWLITKINDLDDDSQNAAYIRDQGDVYVKSPLNEFLVKPTFYLNADVNYDSGNGTKSSPFLIN